MAAEDDNSEDIASHFDLPAEIERLKRHVEGVYEWGFRESDETTISVVVRDSDHEIVGETTLLKGPGVYAFCLVDSDPEDPDAYGSDRSEPPEWVEWIHCDPPLDHFVDGARCLDCGAEKTIARSIPQSASQYTWWLHHRPGCPHASRDDVAYWGRSRYRDHLEARPDPATMALDCLWDEVDALPNPDYCEGEARDGVFERRGAIWDELKERLFPRWPACPDCGGSVEQRGPTGFRCADCRRGQFEDEIWEVYMRERKRLFGYRGHGERSSGGGA